MKNTTSYLLGLLSCLCLLASGCIQHRELMNFTDGEFPEGMELSIPPLVIQVDDLLSVRIKTEDELVSAPFNLDAGTANINSAGGNRPIVGHLVDSEGNIDLPVIGTVAVAGLTLTELRAEIKRKLVGYLVNPTVNIRFLNFRISLGGEVKTPGSFVMPNERVTVLDALSLAGDLTPLANRNNVLVVRVQNGVRSFGRLDLQNRRVFESPFFYLKQNDYVYVEPLPEATAAVRDQTTRILPWIGLGTSLITLLFSIIR